MRTAVPISFLASETGGLPGGSLLAQWTTAEKVVVIGPKLVYKFHECAPDVKLQEETLTSFLRLADAPDQRIAMYAQKRGPLDAHWPYRRSGSCEESVQKWRKRSTELAEIVELGTALRHPYYRAEKSLEFSNVRRSLERKLNVALFMVSPVFSCDEHGCDVRLSVDCLWSWLCMRVALLISGNALAVCRICGGRPEGKRRLYCKKCSETGVAESDASKRYYYRKVEARRRYESGEEISSIARALGCRVARIRAWVTADSKKGTF